MNPPADRPRVVFDCKVLLQAISNDLGPAGRSLSLLQAGKIEVFLSRAAKATHLVSRDKDLLSLATDHSIIAKEFRQRCPGLKLLNPAAFLSDAARL